MSGNIFGSLVDSVKEVFSNPQVLAQGVKDGNIARTGNTEYFIDGKDSFHNMKDAEAASGRWQKRAQDELIGLATIGIGKTAQGLYKGAQTANTVNKGIYLGGKTQPLLGMSKSLPATVNTGTQLATRGTTALAQTANTVNKGNNWTKGIAGTVALGTAVGQGISEPSQKKAIPVASRQRPKYAIGKYNQRSYNRLSQLQKVYGGDLIRQKDGSYFLRNKNGSFYGNGRALNAKTGKMQNYDLYGSGRFLNGNSKQSNSSNIVSTVLDSNYLYGYRGKPRTTLASKTPASNSWINKSRGIWNYNGVSQADVANAYKTGDFSKVGSYLSQHKDLASYLNNIYSKRGGNQFNQSTQTPTVNTMTLQTLDNVVPKSPVKEITPTAELPTAPTPTYNRSQTRDYMRSIGMNPYDYSGGERKALRTYLNNPDSMDSKYQPFINQVQNQRTQKMVDSIGTNQLLKPETDTNKLNNQLVNLKFKQGGQMYKYAAGAQMVQPQQASGQQGIEQQAMALVQAAMQGDQKANQTIQKIMQAAQQGDQQAAQVAQLLKNIVQQMKGSRKARLGAKLDYIKQSIGECPEGQEVVYFKKGGEICKVCAGKKMQNGGKSDPIKDFKKKKDITKQTYQRNPYTRGKSAKEIAEMQRRNRQEAGAGKGENDANVAPWNYKKKR